jgi:hypothetical protein
MTTHRMRLSAVSLDTNIQCRASINMDTVAQYAADMEEGAVFPAVVLFGTADCAYPGDGWHRIMAAQQVGYKEIDADLRPGGIKDALRHALGANRDHGLRRTNADKRRAVEIAAREFPDLSSRAIAELCGVGDQMVGAVRDQVRDSRASTVKGADGKTYPAKRAPKPETEDPDDIAGFRESDGTPPEGTEPAEVLERAPQYKGNTQDNIRLAEIAKEITELAKEASGLQVLARFKGWAHGALVKASKAVANAAEKVGE